MGDRSLWFAATAVASVLIGLSSAILPETVVGVGLGTLWATILGITLYRRELRRSGKWWAGVILVGLLMRLLMVPAHLVVGFGFYKGQVDLPHYVASVRSTGERFLRGEFIRFRGEKLVVVVSSGDIEAVEDFRLVEHLNGFFYFMVGPNGIGLMLVASLLGFLGSYLFWRAFHNQYADERSNRFMALAIFLLPSLVFWTSSLGKDNWVFFFLAWATFSFSKLLERFTLRHALGFALALAGVMKLRFPVAAAMTVSFAVGWLLRRWKGPAAILEPVRVLAYGVVGLGLVGLGIAALGGGGFLYAGLGYVTNPRLMFDRLTERLVEGAFEVHRGYALDPSAVGGRLSVGIQEKTFGSVISYLPEGMLSFLFRPILFEAPHALALGAALESTFFLVLIGLRRRNLIASLRSVFRDPFVAFSLVMMISATAMLSVERNLGAIVRHRSMVIPFLLILLSVPPTIGRRPSRVAVSGPKFGGHGPTRAPG